MSQKPEEEKEGTGVMNLLPDPSLSLVTLAWPMVPSGSTKLTLLPMPRPKAHPCFHDGMMGVDADGDDGPGPILAILHIHAGSVAKRVMNLSRCGPAVTSEAVNGRPRLAQTTNACSGVRSGVLLPTTAHYCPGAGGPQRATPTVAPTNLVTDEARRQTSMQHWLDAAAVQGNRPALEETFAQEAGIEH
ncbi:hypothetical protein E4U55_004341 [Claviceps digitariae]|nr:hypothetical protein E4U55_004341 [Claviceps digitariae]